MDRRQFLKALWASSFVSPFFLSLKTTKKQTYLYLVSDSPQDYLPILLNDMSKKGLIDGPYFSLSDSRGPFTDVQRVLQSKNWHYLDSHKQANLLISFRKLLLPVKPSFVLINQGQIVDIRSNHLRSLWLKLNHKSTRSSLMTIVSCQTKKWLSQTGDYVTVFLDGRRFEKLSLNSNTFKQYKTSRGSISIRINHHQARVIRSSCPHQICRLTPPVSLAGERLICAPNHFLLEVEGSPKIDTAIG